MIIRPAARRRRSDRGSASLELLGMLPLAFIMALIAFQIGAYLWAITHVNEAARQGARAQSLGQNGCAAVGATLSDSLTVLSCSATGGPGPLSSTRLDVSVRVPIVAFVEDYVPQVTVDRTVYLP